MWLRIAASDKQNKTQNSYLWYSHNATTMVTMMKKKTIEDRQIFSLSCTSFATENANETITTKIVVEYDVDV